MPDRRRGPQGLVENLRVRAHHLAAAALLCGFFFVLSTLAANPAHRCAPDEPSWITSSHLTFRLVAEGASPERWQKAYDEAGLGTYGNLNPPVGKWMIGAWIALVRDSDDPIDYVWEWPASYEENLERGNVPPRSLLVSVRVGIALLATLTLAFVYVSALQVTGTRWLALFAPIVLMLSPIFRLHGAQAYMDVPQLFWIAASVVAWGRWLRTKERACFVFSLVAMGLACAVKFSAAPIVVASALHLFVLDLPRRERWMRLVAACLLPFAVFCLVNPYLYDQPVSRVVGLISEWSVAKGEQRLDPLLASAAVHSSLEGLASLARQSVTEVALDHPLLRPLATFRIHLLLAVVAWICFVQVHSRILLPPWQRELRALVPPLFIALIGLWLFGAIGISGVLIAAGLFACFAPRLDGRGGRVAWAAPAGHLAICASAMLVVSGLWLPFHWGRYALPTLVLMPPFYVAAAGLFVEIARNRVSRLVAGTLAQEASRSEREARETP